MEKTNQNLLQKLTQILNVEKIISPEDIQEIRGVLVGVLANNKKEVESLTAETRELVNKVLNKVLDEHDTYLEKSKQIAQEAKSDTTEAIQATMKSLEEVKKLCKEVMECKPENGKDADEEYVIGEVLNRIKLPEYKEVVLDDGGAIVDKINSLPVNEENQIDAKHIKNLPEVKGGRVISGGVTRKIVEQMIEAAGASGSPGGSTTQLQYNNAGAFGGISGATTNGTAVTYTAGNLIAADITASGSGGLLLQSNNGTDALLIGAGGGAGATFYGGVNIAGELTVDTNTLYVDPTNNRVGIGTTSPAQALHVSSATTYQGIFVNGNVAPNISFAQSAGTTAEWKAGISGNAGTSFSISSGASATDRILINSSGFVGLNTNTNPTHTLTLASTSTGIALYNTADQTTNYERGRLFWSSNILTLSTELGGTGTARALQLIAVGSGSNSTLTLTRASLPTLAYTWGSTATTTGSYITFSGTNTASSGSINAFAITPTINQSSTAGYTALLVNPTETTTGSGSKLLADFQVGGTSRFNLSSIGNISMGVTSATNTINCIGSTFNLQVLSTSYVGMNTANAKLDLINGISTAVTNVTLVKPSVNASSSVQNIFSINPTINQSTSAGYTALLVNAVETAVGSGSKLLADFQIGGSSKANIDNTGLITTPQVINTPATITVTSNAGTVTRANRVNNFTNSSAATMTITMSTTSAADGDMVMVRIKDFSAAAQTITWVNTENSTVTAPTTSNGSTTLPLTVGFQYNSSSSKWRCIASA